MAFSTDFNIGRDVTLDLVDSSSGGILSFSIITSFKADPITEDLTSKDINGTNRFDYLPAGWNLTIEFDKASDDLDAWYAAREAAYFAGGSNPPITITETISNPNGTTSQYRFTGVKLKLDNGGEWKGDAITSQQVTGRASRRIKVA